MVSLGWVRWWAQVRLNSRHYLGEMMSLGWVSYWLRRLDEMMDPGLVK